MVRNCIMLWILKNKLNFRISCSKLIDKLAKGYGYGGFFESKGKKLKKKKLKLIIQLKIIIIIKM